MKLRRLALGVLFFIYGCSIAQKQDVGLKSGPAETERQPFFVSVPLTFSTFGTPSVNVDIEDKEFLVKLDLGFRGDASLGEETIDSIADKTLSGERCTYGIRGNEYKKRVFDIPQIRVGPIVFSPVRVDEESREFREDSFFLKKKREIKSPEKGSLGWELFSNTPVLLDIRNSQVSFCDSLDTLKSEGYAVETFTKAPLFLERGLVEIEIETPDGPLLCVLDTGCSSNLFNIPLEDSWEETLWEPENLLEYPFFKIADVDFGPIGFRRMPIKIPVPIEAILGIEFFEDHLVVLDFVGKNAYFLKNAEK